jgi:hypothetical protein
MKPISKIDDNCIQSSNQSSGSKALDENDLAEIEQIVKEKMVSCFFCGPNIHLKIHSNYHKF